MAKKQENDEVQAEKKLPENYRLTFDSKLWYSEDIKTLVSHAESTIEKYNPRAEGMTDAEYNRFVIENATLQELYGAMRGHFVSRSENLRLRIFSSGKTKSGSRRRGLVIKFRPYLNRPCPTGSDVRYGRFSLETDDGKGYVQEVYLFAEHADFIIDIAKYTLVYGEKKAEELAPFKGKMFADVWKSATRTQKEKLLRIAYWSLRDLLLEHPRFMRAESAGPAAFWLEREMERVRVEAEMNFEKAKAALESAQSLVK